ncbi:MAG: thiamine pyrophosphate-dependent enzyme [bacterium]|nr:thiamine pyrophosphate-dependent enzyme [bacterium]
MDNNFGGLYTFLETLDPVHGLDTQRIHISPTLPNGMEILEFSDKENGGLAPRQLCEIYYHMVKMRKIDKAIENLWKRGAAIGKHLEGMGNEATVVGSAYGLKSHDWLSMGIRDIGAFPMRGMDLGELIAHACGRADGTTRGWDYGTHMGRIDLKTIGINISHLGTNIGLAAGHALAEIYRAHGEDGHDGVALAIIGDGATSVGNVHEALNIAAVMHLPLVLLIENNQWAFGTPNALQFAVPTPALRALGYGRHIEGWLIDGTNARAVYQTVHNALERARHERIISVIEARSMRLVGHSMADNPKSYVPKEHFEAWRAKDPIETHRAFLLTVAGTDEKELERLEVKAEDEVRSAVDFAEKSPPPDATDIESKIFTPSPVHIRAYTDPPTEGRRISYHTAIQEALKEEMIRNQDIFLMGEDIGLSDGPFKITAGFSRQFDNFTPEEFWSDPKAFRQRRVVDAPLSEAGFTDVAAGAAQAGLHPCIEFQYFDFGSRAFAEIVNLIATMTAKNMGPMPITFRGPAGWVPGGGPYHTVNPESWFASTPGLKIVAPITAFDAKGLLKAALRDPNPVLFLEYKAHYRTTFENLPPELATLVPSYDYVVPIGKARIVKPGKDATIVTWGSQVIRALEAVHAIEHERKDCSIEVIDLRTIIPFDATYIEESVRRTHKCLVTWEAPLTGSFGNTIAAHIQERVFDHLEASVRRLAAANTPVPASKELEEAHLPTARKVKAAIEALLDW